MKHLLAVPSLVWAYIFAPLRIPLRIAVIPNGNRRWARILALVRWMMGRGYDLEQAQKDVYIHGAKRALAFIAWCVKVGVLEVTFYGLSQENKAKRKEWQIDALMAGATYFFDAADELGYHLHPFGDFEAFKNEPKYKPLYDRLAKWKVKPIPTGRIIVHVAAHYSGTLRHELSSFPEAISRHGLQEVLANPEKYIRSADVSPLDLVIRTGSWRESRTSALLPFQVGYAELYFMWVYWALFTKWHFWIALWWYSRKRRNFGR